MCGPHASGAAVTHDRTYWTQDGQDNYIAIAVWLGFFSRCRDVFG